MKKVCIIVPAYKQSLNPFERISLCQFLKILGNYPVYIVQPASAKIEYEELKGWEYSVCKYPDYYFQSTATYSKLLLSPFFYEKFLEYEYMLVYQLDCFVFSDRLLEFCNMKYDYIGAPQYHTWTNEVAVVGNGGFSLRKINAVLHLTKKFNDILQGVQQREFFSRREDNFFSYCGEQKELNFTVPDVSVANTFSTVIDIEGGIQHIPVRGLPFGTHAWHRLNFDFWKKVIETFGYQTNNLIAEKNIDTLAWDQSERFKTFFLNTVYQLPSWAKQEIIGELGLSADERYGVWGVGNFGRKMLKFLFDLGVNVSVVFDKSLENSVIYGNTIKYPDFIEIREKKLTILIGSIDYEEEIEIELLRNGCRHFIKLASNFIVKWKKFQERYCKYFPEIKGVTVSFDFITDYSWLEKLS